MYEGNQHQFTYLPLRGLIQTIQAVTSAEMQRWEKPGKAGEVRFHKRRGRNGLSLQQVCEVEMAACEDMKGYAALGLGAEPALLQTAKAP